MNFIDKHFTNIMIALVVIITMFSGIWLVKRDMPPRIVKIDIISITQHYTELMVKDTISSKDLSVNNPQVKKISEAIKANLEPLIAQYAKNNNVIVIQAQAIVGNSVTDITPTIIKELDQKIK